MMPSWMYLEWPSVSVEHPGEEGLAQHQPAHVDICRLRGWWRDQANGPLLGSVPQSVSTEFLLLEAGQ